LATAARIFTQASSRCRLAPAASPALWDGLLHCVFA